MNSDTPMDRAITDARALLDTLLTSDWQDMHVLSGGTEIFIARTGGRANPMRSASEPLAPPSPAPVAAPETPITAQHVATLVDIAPVGTVVQAGQKVATIRVLDEEEALLAPVAGHITDSAAAEGALIEYGMTILRIAQAA